MSIESPDYLKHFGEIKFAEENSMCINDYEHALKRHRSYKFGEINNSSIKDFEKSLKNYFW